MTTNTPYLHAAPNPLGSYDQSWAQLLTSTLNAIVAKLNNVLTVTLTANAATTTVTDNRLFSNSVLVFMPTTAHAAAALTSLYVPTTTQKKGSAVIQHVNDANTDKTYSVAILG